MVATTQHYRKKSTASSNKKTGHGNNRKNSQSKTSGNKKEVICTYCNKRNHTADCRIRQCHEQLGGLSLRQLNEIQSVISNFNAHKSYQAEQTSEPELENSSDDTGKASYRPEEVNLVANFIEDNIDQSWVVDSGASLNFSNSKVHCDSFPPQTLPNTVATANGSHMPVVGTGTMTFGNNKSSQVLYVPAIKSNLLSVGSLTD
jgi:hypothetical protein